MSKIKLVKNITAKGYPYHSANYRSAHNEANKAEKIEYPKGYSKLKKEEKNLKKNELMGTNKKSGKIQVESKYKKNSKEIAYHEKKESQALKRIAAKHKKK